MKPTITRILIIVTVLTWAQILLIVSGPMHPFHAIVGVVDVAVIGYCGWALWHLWTRDRRKW
jgi:hypothetical protein